MKKVAIFDIDGTIFRSSLLIEVTEALIAAGVFPQKARDSYKKSFEQWLDRKASYEIYIGEVVKAFEKYIPGVKRADFLRITKKMLSIHQERVYRYTRSLVHDLKKKGYFMLAISHSPKDLVDGFCKKMGFDKVYGSVYEYDTNKKFTGKKLYLDFFPDKEKILLRAVGKENLTLKNSVGVGDSHSDIAFLKLVQNPICFNPNSALYAHAKKAKWKVVVERKDVIYTL